MLPTARTFLVIGFAVAAVWPQQSGPMDAPTGWRLGGTLNAFTFVVDTVTVRSGKHSGRLSVVAGSPTSVSASANQAIRAEPYRGKRIRLTGYLKSRDAVFVAWARVEGLQRDSLEYSGLSNVSNEETPVTVDWRRIEHVIDVPAHAEAIVFGVFLRRSGDVWLDDFDVAVVDARTPTTELGNPPNIIRRTPAEMETTRARWLTLPATPANPGFEAIAVRK
jgi:hypothetical protein